MKLSKPPKSEGAKRREREDRAERKRLKAYRDAVADFEQLAPEATGQTILKMARDEPALPQLKRLRKLNAWELTAATEIVVGFHVSAGLAKPPDDPDLGRSTIKPDAAERIAIGQIDARRSDIVEKYRRWRTDLDGHPALSAAVAMLFDEVPALSVDRANRWRNGTAKQMLVLALRHMAALRGNTPRGARGWRLPERNRILEEAVQLAKLVPRPKKLAVDSRGNC